jgi:1-deoxy-D-xylulose-5-phosphate reductoisomerase
MVEFIDGSVKAQLSSVDMRIPIGYALSYPHRLVSNSAQLDFKKLNKLEFFDVPKKKFECLDIAYHCLKKGGNAATILNAANEIAVEEFIKERIGFFDIPKLINSALDKIAFIPKPSLDELFTTDTETRNFVRKILKKK